MRVRCYVFALAISLMFTGLSFSEETRNIPEIQTIQGTVSEIDSVGSTLEVSDGSKLVRFSVDEAVKIQCGTEEIMLDEVEQNDPVTVEYYKAADGTLKAVSIIDSSLATGF